MNASLHYLHEITRLTAVLPGRQLPWLKGLRSEAMGAFAINGFPTTRDEDWKYTSMARIEQGKFSFLAAAPTILGADDIAALALPGAHRLVFVDGRHAPGLSSLSKLPDGITVASLAAMLERNPETLRIWLARPGVGRAAGFAALNTACMTDGAYVHLAPGTILERPLQLLFVATTPALASHSRNLVVAEANSRACIVEHHAAVPGAAAYFTNIVSDIVVGQGACIEHHKLQEEGTQAFHVAAVNAELARDSHFMSTSFALGGVLARTDINVGLQAEGADCTLDGLYLADGRQHMDHHTRIDHARPHGTSREFYKGVLAGAARAVFNGKVIVHPGAQHSDAEQINRNLLLSEQAEIDTKPQLEIWADDVKCSHGATVGQLDPEQIFYLRARGMAEAEARTLLTHAFAAEMVERVHPAPLRARLDRLLRERLAPGSKATS